MEAIWEETDYIGEFGDARLKAVGAKLYKRMLTLGQVGLRVLGQTRKGEIQFGRWLRNRKVTHQEITSTASQKTGQLAIGLHVLAIQDSSEINYQKHAKRIQGGLGLGRKWKRYRVIHPSAADH